MMLQTCMPWKSQGKSILFVTCLATSIFFHFFLFFIPAQDQQSSQSTGIIIEIGAANDNLLSANEELIRSLSVSSENSSSALLKDMEELSPNVAEDNKKVLSQDRIKPATKEKKQKSHISRSAVIKPGAPKTGSREPFGEKSAPTASVKGNALSTIPARVGHNNRQPDYPPIARKRSQEGTVIIRCLVGINGKALKLEINKTSGHSQLDAAALKTVRNWSFIPAQKDGAPYESYLLIPVEFHLKKR